MSAGHCFAEPREPFAYWQDAEPDDAAMDANDALSLADRLAQRPGVQLAASLAWMIDARERLNDAIAKAEAHQERTNVH